VSQNVLAIGGTVLNSYNGQLRNESVWSRSGCNVSSYITKPVYQSKVNNSSYRVVPDLCAISYIQIYYNNNYIIAEGTSISCPFVAGMLSIACSIRNNNNSIRLSTVNNSQKQIQLYLYQVLYTPPDKSTNTYTESYCKGCILDITSGINGNIPIRIGYDNATGLGSPNCQQLIESLSTY
jgi:hypothetical protein